MGDVQMANSFHLKIIDSVTHFRSRVLLENSE